MNVVAEVIPDGGAGHGQRADVYRNPLALRHQLAVAVQYRGGKIPAGVENLRHGGAQHRLGHLLRDGLQPVLHHGKGDGVVIREAVLDVTHTRTVIPHP